MAPTEPGLRFRLASAADLSVIRSIVRNAYGHYVERMGRLPAPMTADYVRLVEERVVSVVEIASEVAGLAVLRYAADHLLVSSVAVTPALQGLGLGRALLGHAEAQARSHGLHELRLYTHESMHENVAIYTRLGWEEYGRAEHEGFRRVFMRKRLAPVGA